MSIIRGHGSLVAEACRAFVPAAYSSGDQEIIDFVTCLQSTGQGRMASTGGPGRLGSDHHETRMEGTVAEAELEIDRLLQVAMYPCVTAIFVWRPLGCSRHA